MFERAGLRAKNFSDRAIPSAKLRFRRATMGALTAVFDPAVATFAAHARVEIREMEPSTRHRHCDRICRVEAEEPDSRLAAVPEVGADVELGKCGECRQRRSGAQTDTRHAKRHDADPGFALECVDIEGIRNLRSKSCAQLRNVGAPVGEEEVVPGWRHDPWAGGKRPWAMCDFG